MSNKITDTVWWELSDLMMRRTRELSEEDWQSWSSGGWRMMSNDILNEILDKLDIKVVYTSSMEEQDEQD